MAVAASWDPQLVALSYIVAVFASYTALDFAGKVTATRGWARIAWLGGGAFAMGTGIWAMHFTGMQAFKVAMPVTYDVLVTLLSMVIAIAASALALLVVSRGVLRAPQLLVAGPIMGVGIASMHYTGMAAMRMPATISYDPFLFALSVLIAIVASMAALWLAFKFSLANNTGGRWRWMKGGSALVMGAAIVGMHYTGMAAANFVPTDESTAGASSGINTLALGFGIGITTLTILGLALVSSMVDRRFSAQTAELEKSERRYESLFRHNLDGVYSLDLEGKFLTANAAAEKITGFQAEELHQKSLVDLVVEEDSGRASHYFERAVWGEAQTYEIAITNKEGRRVELNVTNIPIVVMDEVIGIYGIAKDVTERQRAEKEIRKLNETLERRVTERTAQLERQAATLREQAELLELTHDAVMVLDMDSKIAFWNRGAEELYGWSKEEAVGKVSHALLRTRFPRPFEEIKAEVLREEHWEGEVVHHKRDGTPIMVASRWALQRDERGDPVRILKINNDVTERKALEEQLEHQALHDPLTDLPNRILLMDGLEQALAHAQQRGHEVATLFVDLDNFKVINDSLGHEIGDKLLVSVGRHLRALVRPGDTVARFGGDEFVVVLDESDADEVDRVAQRLVEGMRTLFVLDGHELTITCSVGIALGGGSAGEGPTYLLRRADMALYEAKNKGKNRYEVFEEAMEAHALERLEKEHLLRQTTEREEGFVIHYQPVVSLDEGGRIVGFEALVRWNHPWRELLLPAEFLPIAEQTSMIIGIGRWVLREACRQAQEWHERHPSEQPLTMSVNLSASQLAHPGLVEDVVGALRSCGLEPRSLVLEVTESAMMEEMEASAAVLRRLKELGVRIALDDFGKDHSSLSYLKRLPVDMLKIDRFFVDGLGTDQKDEGIVRAVIDLARTLGLEVVAEGVESGEQLAHLREVGCNLAQGFYFWRSLPAEKANELLATYNYP